LGSRGKKRQQKASMMLLQTQQTLGSNTTGKQTVRKSASFSPFHFLFVHTQQDVRGDNVKKKKRGRKSDSYYIHKRIVHCTHTPQNVKSTHAVKKFSDAAEAPSMTS